MRDNTNLQLLHIMLRLVDKVYVNSDAHTASEFMYARKRAFEKLEELKIYDKL